MQTGNILTNLAILFLAAALWDDLRRGARLTTARKTWLLVACIFAAVSLALQIFPH